MLEWERQNLDRVWREDSPYFKGYGWTRFHFMKLELEGKKEGEGEAEAGKEKSKQECYFRACLGEKVLLCMNALIASVPSTVKRPRKRDMLSICARSFPIILYNYHIYNIERNTANSLLN